MSTVDLVIFDCDGVLVDSEIVASRIEAELLSGAGYDIGLDTFIERFSGMSWRDILRVVAEETGPALPSSLLGKAEIALDAQIPLEATAMEGVHAALTKIPYKRCICSNTKLARLDAVLTNLGLKAQFSPNIFSAKDLGDGRSKPKPDIFLFGAERMRANRSRTVVVEDSVHGITAARSAGMRVIGFTGGSHSYPEHGLRLRDAGASEVVSRMRDLPATIEEVAR